jgi:hypothetical protein
MTRGAYLRTTAFCLRTAHPTWPKPNKPVTRGNKALMVSKT